MASAIIVVVIFVLLALAILFICQNGGWQGGCGGNCASCHQHCSDKEKQEKKGYPSVAYELAEKIQNRMDQEVRITVPGHTQRGGSPCPYDRVLATRLGAAAADLILKEDYGYMVGIKNGNIRKVPLGEVAGKLKMVDPKADIIKEAKIVGISFGDE